MLFSSHFITQDNFDWGWIQRRLQQNSPNHFDNIKQFKSMHHVVRSPDEMRTRAVVAIHALAMGLGWEPAGRTVWMDETHILLGNQTIFQNMKITVHACLIVHSISRRASWHVHWVQIPQILVTSLRTQCDGSGPWAVDFLANLQFANDPHQETSAFGHVLDGARGVPAHIHAFHRGILRGLQILVVGLRTSTVKNHFDEKLPTHLRGGPLQFLSHCVCGSHMIDPFSLLLLKLPNNKNYPRLCVLENFRLVNLTFNWYPSENYLNIKVHLKILPLNNKN